LEKKDMLQSKRGGKKIARMLPEYNKKNQKVKKIQVGRKRTAEGTSQMRKRKGKPKESEGGRPAGE